MESGWSQELERLRYVHCGVNKGPQPVGQRFLYAIWVCRADSAVSDISVLSLGKPPRADLTWRPLVGTA